MQDRAARFRSRSIGVRVTEADFARLQGLADAQGKLLGEWARDALLALAQHPAGTAVEQALLAEILALRTVVANLLFAFASDGRVTREQMLGYIDRADATKLARAIEEGPVTYQNRGVRPIRSRTRNRVEIRGSAAQPSYSFILLKDFGTPLGPHRDLFCPWLPPSPVAGAGPRPWR